MLNEPNFTSLPVYTVTLPQSDDHEQGFKDTSLTSPNEIGIVPPFKPEVLEREAPATPVNLTYRGGHLLTNVEVVLTFWGDVWTQQPQSDLVQEIGQFFNVILSSQLMDQLAEYSVPGKTIGHGQLVGTALICTSLDHQVSYVQLQQMLQQLISNNPTFPQPTPNRLYFLYLPPSVEVVLPGEHGDLHSCQAFCGYHDVMQGNIFYAVMPFPCQGFCTHDLSILDALTSVSSHELCEAITDPIPPQGWFDDANGEIGDVCTWKVKQVGNYTVQQEWSNQANACI
jgi:hypothetical protein